VLPLNRGIETFTRPERVRSAGDGTNRIEMRWESVSMTDRGLQRPNNEDAYLERPQTGMFAVADGMGGHAAGEIASRIAVEALAQAVANRSPVEENHSPLVRSFSVANREIRRRGRVEPETRGMGTTLSVLAGSAAGGRGVIVHIGDSRVYRYRDARLEQLTRDHTWVQERIDAGVLTPDQARTHPYSSILTRVLGTEDQVTPDVIPLELKPRDLFLLCSDGLSGMVPDAVIEAILARGEALPETAQRLVDAAKAGGGIDNVTLVLARVTE
jgi:protein phosphatase